MRRAPSVVRRVLRALGDEPPPAVDPEPPEVSPDLVPLLRELGTALLDSGRSVTDVGDDLEAVARRSGASTVGTLVLPTGVFVRVSTAGGTVADFAAAAASGLNLDQIGALTTLVHRLRTTDVPLADARAELRAVVERPPRFGAVLTIVGHGLLTTGFGLVLNPTARLLPVYLALGILVGALRWLGTRWPTLATALPVVAAFVVTLLAIDVVHPWLGDDPLSVLVPPLVSFLPGSVLTVAAIELTSNQIVAGASRLVYGVAQLLLLVFGVVAGAAGAGPPVAPPAAAHRGGWGAGGGGHAGGRGPKY
ncbi:MAG: threonine/serine exporter family protein [Cellulosimicrobium cellulans]